MVETKADVLPAEGAQRQADTSGPGMALGAGGLGAGRVKAFLTETEASIELEDSRRVHAVQAASCLLAPAIGDRVLVYSAGSESHILAVLERDPARAAQVSVPGAGAVTLRAGKRLELKAAKVDVAAREINFFARTISQTGEALTSSFRKVLESIVDKTVGARTITTKVATRTAVVEEVDTLKTGLLVQEIDKVATQNSEISMITAKQDVRLDATRVSVG